MLLASFPADLLISFFFSQQQIKSKDYWVSGYKRDSVYFPPSIYSVNIWKWLYQETQWSSKFLSCTCQSVRACQNCVLYSFRILPQPQMCCHHPDLVLKVGVAQGCVPTPLGGGSQEIPGERGGLLIQSLVWRLFFPGVWTHFRRADLMTGSEHCPLSYSGWSVAWITNWIQ